MNEQPIYLDAQATTPVDPRVLEAMLPFLAEKFGNAASGSHAYGREARDAVDRAREQVAALIGATAREILFTSGATEANNLVLRGVVQALRTKGNHLVTVATEHKSVLDTCAALERERAEHREGLRRVIVAQRSRSPLLDQRAASTSALRSSRGVMMPTDAEDRSALPNPGDPPRSSPDLTPPTDAELDALEALHPSGARVTRLPVDREGRVSPDALGEALSATTVLFSAMFANNEIGVLHPISKLGALCRERGVLFHCDAAQGLSTESLDVTQVPVDFVSLSAHKLHGPKGIGALYVREASREHRPRAQILGGGHERGLRSGTLNVPAIVGFGVAAALASRERDSERARLTALRERFLEALLTRVKRVVVHGPRSERLAGNLNLSFELVDARALLERVPSLALSAGSACTSGALEPSHVLRALGVPNDLARSAVRIGFGRFTTELQVDQAVDALAREVALLRKSHPAWRPVD